MLNGEVYIEDREMQRIDCDILEQDFPQTPEPIGISTQQAEVIEIHDTSSDEEKEGYHVSSKDVTEETFTEQHAQTDANLQREQHAQPATDLQKDDERDRTRPTTSR